MNSTRRGWLAACISAAAWPEIVAAQEHARHAVALSSSGAFEVLSASDAAEIEALAAQILPSDDGPGAKEAGVIYFIDRALSTFASDQRTVFRTGLAEAERKREDLFPDSMSIASLSSAQQMQLVRGIEKSEFFELLRTFTVLGFLADPSYGGNRDKVGWRQIGFEDRMMWEPPFGYYDAEAAGGSK